MSDHKPIILQILATAMVYLSVFGGLNVDVLPIINKIVGACLAICLFMMLYEKFLLPKEAALYFLFVGWAFLSGSVSALNSAAVGERASTLFQLGVFFYAVILSHTMRSNISFTFYGILGIGLLLVVMVLGGGDIGGLLYAPEYNRLRTASINPNGLGEIWLFGIVGCFYIYSASSTKIKKYLALTCIILFIIFLLLTGSRKMFLGALVAGTAWSAFRLISRPNLYIIPLMIIFSFSFAFFGSSIIDFWDSTPMATRFMLLEKPKELSGLGVRMNLLREGLDLFFESPFTGIGLGNFELRSWSAAVSHCDYIEVLSTTGLIGALLYYPIFIILWRRMSVLPKTNVYIEGVIFDLFRTIFILLIFLMVGFSYFGNILFLYVMGAFSGYSYSRFQK